MIKNSGISCLSLAQVSDLGYDAKPECRGGGNRRKQTVPQFLDIVSENLITGQAI